MTSLNYAYVRSCIRRPDATSFSVSGIPAPRHAASPIPLSVRYPVRFDGRFCTNSMKRPADAVEKQSLMELFIKHTGHAEEGGVGIDVLVATRRS